MKRTQGVAIRLNRARTGMILNRFADTGIIGKRTTDYKSDDLLLNSSDPLGLKF